jgi:transcriptional regulator with XRE-family HTH domain
MIDTEKLGREVKRIRNQCGWSQRTLASKAGISAGIVSMLENGIHGVSNTLLGKIGKAFGVPASFLIILAEDSEDNADLLEIIQATVRAGLRELCPPPCQPQKSQCR